jgi:hypothetical protein
MGPQIIAKVKMPGHLRVIGFIAVDIILLTISLSFSLE